MLGSRSATGRRGNVDPATPRSMRGEFDRTFVSLRTRNYRLFWLGQVVSATGNWLTNLALALLVLHLTNSGLAVGAISACMYGPILLLSSWGGALADRVDKRKVLIVTQALELAQSAVLGVLAFMGHPPLVWIFVVAFAGGCLLAVDNPSRRALVTELVPQVDVANAVILYTALNTTSQIVGPALAGLLIATTGFGWCFMLDALSYFFVLAALVMMRPADMRRHHPVPRVRGQTLEGLRYVVHDPTMRFAFAIMAIAGTFSYRWNTTLPLFSERTLHASDSEFTFLFAVFSLGALCAALGSARGGTPSLRSILLWTAGLGLSLALLASVPTLTLAYIAVFVVGVASVRCVTSITALVQVKVVGAMQGRVLALQAIFMLGTTPFSAPALGWLADRYGGRAPVLAGSAAAVIAAVVGLAIHRHDTGGQLSGRRATMSSAYDAPLPADLRAPASVAGSTAESPLSTGAPLSTYDERSGP
jgi:MFS family permease